MSFNITIVQAAKKSKALDLSFSGLTEIPRWVFTISGLRELNLQNNELTMVDGAAVLKHLPHLTHLNLSTNRITDLPEELGLLPELCLLDVSSNRIGVLPCSFYRLLEETQMKLFTTDYFGQRTFKHHSLKQIRNGRPLHTALFRHHSAPIEAEEKRVCSFNKLKLTHNPIVQTDDHLDASALWSTLFAEHEAVQNLVQADVVNVAERARVNRVKRLRANRKGLQCTTFRNRARFVKESRVGDSD